METMLASPLNPSIIFIALTIPTIAKAVNKSEIISIFKRGSKKGRSTLIIFTSRNLKTKSAEIIRKIILILGESFPERSF